ncbi:MAG: hypothetical protein ACSHYF_10895 [Verrucomicrobiaceae bacterium]
MDIQGTLILLAILGLGFWIFAKVTQVLIKVAFIVVALIVVIVMYGDQLPI